MLLRFTLSAAGALVLASTATAQINTAQAKPITSTIKDAGVYNLATGTWTRGVSAAALAGPEVLYDNTCTSGYYWGMSDGDNAFDSGRLPSTGSPDLPPVPGDRNSLTGLYDCYEIDGFQIGYCSFEPNVTTLTVSFTDTYAACDGGGILPTPIAVFNLVNVPAGTSAGAIGCWLVGFDLANTTFAFNLGGDGDGTYSNTPSTDSFGWSWTQSIPTTGSDSGPILSGDYAGFFANSAVPACTLGVGGGTTFVGGSALAGTGMGSVAAHPVTGIVNGAGSRDQMEIGDGPTNPGCYWFGGYSAANPMASFFIQIQGGEGIGCGTVPDNSGTPYCFGDVALCPCGNVGGATEGCSNSTGAGATLTGSGNASIAADTLTFDVAGVNGQKFGLVFRANNQASLSFGDGLLCATGSNQRSDVVTTDAGGAVSVPVFQGGAYGAGLAAGDTRNYQFWYRDPMGSPCGGGFNFTNAWTVTYMP